MATTKRRTDEGGETVYDVRLPDGDKIGEVRRAWFALGGDGWTHDGIFGHPTRADAVQSLVRKFWDDVRRKADGFKLCD